MADTPGDMPYRHRNPPFTACRPPGGAPARRPLSRPGGATSPAPRVVRFADLLLQAVMGGSWVLRLSCPDAQFTDAPPRGPVFGAQAPPEAYRCCGHGTGEPLGDGQEAVGGTGGDGQGHRCRSGEQRGGRDHRIPPSPTGRPVGGPGRCRRNPRSRRDAARHPGWEPHGVTHRVPSHSGLAPTGWVPALPFALPGHARGAVVDTVSGVSAGRAEHGFASMPLTWAATARIRPSGCPSSIGQAKDMATVHMYVVLTPISDFSGCGGQPSAQGPAHSPSSVSPSSSIALRRTIRSTTSGSRWPIWASPTWRDSGQVESEWG